ncbi:uncharacterized protein LOC111102176 [Crassostrea virginica]
MFEDSQTSKQGWVNRINNEDFRQEFFGHQKGATLQLEERHINKTHVSEDFISFERDGSTNGRRFTHKTIVLSVLVLSCVVVLAVAGTVIFIFSKPDCNTSSLSTTTLSNLLNITAPTTIPSRRTTPSATFSTTNSPQTKTTKISSATTAQTTSIKTSATTTTTRKTTTVITTIETPVIITIPSTTTTTPKTTTEITTIETPVIITIPSTTPHSSIENLSHGSRETVYYSFSVLRLKLHVQGLGEPMV